MWTQSNENSGTNKIIESILHDSHLFIGKIGKINSDSFLTNISKSNAIVYSQLGKSILDDQKSTLTRDSTSTYGLSKEPVQKEPVQSERKETFSNSFRNHFISSP